MRFFDSYTWDDAEQYVDEVFVSVQAILHAHNLLVVMHEAAEVIHQRGDAEQIEEFEQKLDQVMTFVWDHRLKSLEMFPRK